MKAASTAPEIEYYLMGNRFNYGIIELLTGFATALLMCVYGNFDEHNEC